MKRTPLKLPPDTVGVADARRNLIDLINRVLASGKPVTISRRGKAVARIAPLVEKTGLEWRKHLRFAEDDPFYDAMEEILCDRKLRPIRGSRGLTRPRARRARRNP